MGKAFKVDSFATLNFLMDDCLLNLQGTVIFIINLLNVFESIDEAVLFTKILNNKIHIIHGLGLFFAPFDPKILHGISKIGTYNIILGSCFALIYWIVRGSS